MKLLSRTTPPTVESVRAVTGYSVVELAKVFEIDRRAVYLWKEKNNNHLPTARHFELIAKRPELYEKD